MYGGAFFPRRKTKDRFRTDISNSRIREISQKQTGRSNQYSAGLTNKRFSQFTRQNVFCPGTQAITITITITITFTFTLTLTLLPGRRDASFCSQLKENADYLLCSKIQSLISWSAYAATQLKCGPG